MRSSFLFLFLFFSITGTAQLHYYNNPLKIPILLSGSFAELRSNHFHSGIDIKTQGTTGLPVSAVADGYVARISVSPTGFGKAIYINHPNGTTSVYGHLSHFSSDIEKYVKNKQYEKQSFRIDLQIPSYLFPVKQDEEIAKSGNSGSSGGPHLHFEIRDTKTEEPLNPLKYNFPVADHIAPKIFSLLVVPLSDESHVNYGSEQQSYPVVFYDGKYHLKNNPTLPVWGEIGLAVQTNDYLDGTYNKCGINLLRMVVDDESYFTFQLNRFAFKNSRYINSHIVYDEYVNSKRQFQKTWLEPGNHLPIYNHNGSFGIISPKEAKTQHVEIELQDTYGNSSVLVFSIKGSFKQMEKKNSKAKALFRYNQMNHFHNNEIELTIPEGALYKNIDFIYKKETAPNKFYSDYHFIHKKTVPLHKNAVLKLKVDGLPAHLQTKTVMVNIDTLTGEFYAAGGKYKNGWVTSNTNVFGVYAVAVDTIPPTISALSIKNAALTEPNRIRFKIEDDLAGIEKIEGYLDNKWVLFEYDPKTKRITHFFDKDRFEFNKRHDLKLTVTDYKGNSSVFEANFWK